MTKRRELSEASHAARSLAGSMGRCRVAMASGVGKAAARLASTAGGGRSGEERRLGWKLAKLLAEMLGVGSTPGPCRECGAR